MNTEAMVRLADFLENVEPSGFRMAGWWEKCDDNICGMAACVAGWAVFADEDAKRRFWSTKLPDVENDAWLDSGDFDFSFENEGRDLLGLTDGQAYHLFMNTESWQGWLDKLECGDYLDHLDDITVKHAIMVLRGLASGLLKWPYTCDD